MNDVRSPTSTSTTSSRSASRDSGPTGDDHRTTTRAEPEARSPTTGEALAKEPTRAEKRASEPTTAERLDGGRAAPPGGSLAAAQQSHENLSAQESRSWPHDQEGVSSTVGYTVSGITTIANLVGAFNEKTATIDAVKRTLEAVPDKPGIIDLFERATAPTVTSKQAGRMVSEYASDAAVALIQNPTALSRAIGRVTAVAGFVFAPLTGAYKGFVQAGPDATVGRKVASAYGGGGCARWTVLT